MGGIAVIAVVGFIALMLGRSLSRKGGDEGEKGSPPSDSSSSPPASGNPPPAVVDAAKNASTKTASELEDASRQAKEAGYPKTAEILQDKADVKRELERIKGERLPDSLKSPISGVSDSAWSQFVRLSKQGNVSTITPGYNLGMFIINMRQVEDHGMARNVTKHLVPTINERGEEVVDENGKPEMRAIWDGDWIPPYSLEKFLSSPRIQYELFTKISKRNLSAIKARYSEYIGQDIEGSKATLSGLLAVAKRAGLGGLEKWLKEPSSRKSATTGEYTKFNGLF